MKKKIYIADDDDAILEICTMVLENEGYEVETSVDGKSIVNRENNLPNLVLLDVLMSGTSGNEICNAIKGHATTRHLPVVLMSANRNLHEVGSTCGADAVLAKPFDIYKLVALVHQFSGKADATA